MWKRDEAVRPAGEADPSAAHTPAPAGRPFGKDPATIGPSVKIKGELSGSEDLRIDGQVEGRIQLDNHALTVGPNGTIHAQVSARVVTVQGHVIGNVSASERVEIRESGSVDGDIVAPRVAIADGAVFRGSVDMQPSGKKASAAPQPAGAPATAPNKA
jgi:cytoskeletal protein CcmA (bactofilin family)